MMNFSAYLAGFTEAEGSFYDGYNKKGKKISRYGWNVSNTNKSSFIHSVNV